MLRLNLIGEDRQWASPIDGRKSKSVLWNSINWEKARRTVNRLQARIVKAVKAGLARSLEDQLLGAQQRLINA